jgi:thioredoxin reductase (NADPH)
VRSQESHTFSRLTQQIVPFLKLRRKRVYLALLLRYPEKETGEEKTIPCTGFFVAIGHQPNTDIFKDYIDLDETGYIKYAQPGTSKTNVAGVFVAGDAADKTYRQAITAAGTGCMAALDAERYLSAKDH